MKGNLTPGPSPSPIDSEMYEVHLAKERGEEREANIAAFSHSLPHLAPLSFAASKGEGLGVRFIPQCPRL